MGNKKAFTLVETIVVIVLIGLIGIGSTIAIINVRNSSLDKKRMETFKIFDNALDVYLSEHSEILSNLSNKVEGAVISLEVLKNEGLVNDNIIDPKTKKVVDYKNNYYVLSDAVLMDNNSSNGDEECAGRIGINVIQSWNLNNVDSDDILYVCTKNSNNGGNVNLNFGYAVGDNYQEAIKEPYYFKGISPNNYAKYNETLVNILSINIDDSIVLYGKDEDLNKFNSLITNISYHSIQQGNHETESACSLICIDSNAQYKQIGTFINNGFDIYTDNILINEGIVNVDCTDITKTSYCRTDTKSNSSYSWENEIYSYNINLGTLKTNKTSGDNKENSFIIANKGIKKVRLKPCVKITGGIGDSADPFILENKC